MNIRFIRGQNRFPLYLNAIKEVFDSGRSVIVLFSDIAALDTAQKIIREKILIEPVIAYRKQPDELKIWEKIRNSEKSLVIGTRSAIFSPVKNLGLIIVDDEDNRVYKQEQAPHYNAREVALMRGEIENARLILGATNLSLESVYLAQKEELKYESPPVLNKYPEIKVIDPFRQPYAKRWEKSIFTKFLLDSIYSVLEQKGRVLLVINRKGFATSAICHNCAAALKCPRCNINLVFHFDSELLKCHHCNFNMPVPKICPKCEAGYIKFSGTGTEKVESELSRIFPQARINQDIFVSTGAVLKNPQADFDLIGVLALDNLINRIDFRAVEKTFSLLFSLTSLTSKRVIIQSANTNHYCLQAIIKNDPEIFYREELKQRKQLGFSPFKHLILVRLRAANFDKVKKAAYDLFEKISSIKTPNLKTLSLNPGQPAKLRGNYYFQILIRASNPQKASHFLKLHLTERHYSGIIISVDVDPV